MKIYHVFVMCCSMFLIGCGGTFTLRPDGSLSYTTPEILKAPIVTPDK